MMEEKQWGGGVAGAKRKEGKEERKKIYKVIHWW